MKTGGGIITRKVTANSFQCSGGSYVFFSDGVAIFWAVESNIICIDLVDPLQESAD